MKETLSSINKKPYGALNVKKHSFFLTIKGKKSLVINTPAYYHIVK